MPRNYTVTIPTSPYVKAFISKLYGDPVIINNKTTIGSFLIGVLTKKSVQTKYSPEKKDTRFTYFRTEFCCIAPWNQMDNYGYYLTENHVIQINRYFENLFDEQLFFYVQRRINAGSRYAGFDKALESFIVDYNMPEETTVEALKQMEYRFRKNLSKKFLPTLTPRKPAPQKLLFA